MDPVLKWKKEVEITVNKYARNHTYDQKEDLRQDCYLRILERSGMIPQNDIEGRRYVIEICKSIIMMDTRKSQRRIPAEADVQDVPADSEPTPFGISQLELRQAMDKLDPKSRYIIDSIFFRNKTETEVGDDLDSNRRKINYAKKLALDKLREVLNGR
jgi:RNA polymerase sigma factor (sigma-70 family)